MKLTLRPAVAAFAYAMEAQLRANDHKSGWKRDTAIALMRRLNEEALELHAEITEEFDPSKVLKKAADVANFSMMIADVCGGLKTMREVDESAMSPRWIEAANAMADAIKALDKANLAGPDFVHARAMMEHFQSLDRPAPVDKDVEWRIGRYLSSCSTMTYKFCDALAEGIVNLIWNGKPPFPTEWAYAQVCDARTKWQARAEISEKEVERLSERIKQDLQKNYDDRMDLEKRIVEHCRLSTEDRKVIAGLRGSNEKYNTLAMSNARWASWLLHAAVEVDSYDGHSGLCGIIEEAKAAGIVPCEKPK